MFYVKITYCDVSVQTLENLNWKMNWLIGEEIPIVYRITLRIKIYFQKQFYVTLGSMYITLIFTLTTFILLELNRQVT